MNPSRLSVPVRYAAVLACLALLAGCGGNDDSSSDRGSSGASSTSATAGDSTSPSAGDSSSASSGDAADTSDSASTSPSASGTPSPASTEQGAAFAALSGQEISDSAKASMLALQSVHYSGSVAQSSGNITLDVQAKADGDCTGTVGIQGGKATVLAVGGTSWFKGDRKFWKAAAGASAGQIIKAVGTKWVLDTNHDFGQFCALDQFLGNLFSSTGGSTYTTQGTSQQGGQEVVAVQRTVGTDPPSTGYVLTDGPHYLVRIEKADGGKQGQLSFSAFDQDFDVKAPAADNVIDPASLG